MTPLGPPGKVLQEGEQCNQEPQVTYRPRPFAQPYTGATSQPYPVPSDIFISAGSERTRQDIVEDDNYAMSEVVRDDN